MQDSGKTREPAFAERVIVSLSRKWQHVLDRSTIYIFPRWGAFAGLLCVYMLRVYLLQAFYIVTYGLGIFLLNLFIGFLSPQVDPEGEGPILPSASTQQEFRPFSRKVPEFRFWYNATKAVFISICLTFFTMFDIPVFWPILLIYFIALFALTMKRQIRHMWKHNYVPWTTGKKTYAPSKLNK